jgi:hypothetical protein
LATDPATYRISAADLLAFLREPGVAAAMGGVDPTQLDALAGSFQYVDYFVSGNFASANFLGNGDRPLQDATFQIDLTGGGGQSQVADEQVPFLIAVPKATANHSPPFPTVIVGHGDKSSRFDMLAFAGTFAKFGLASASIDAFGHGLAPDAATAAALRAAAQTHGIGAFADVVLSARARDLDNDGIADPGGDLWSGQMFHTRDVLRQSVADWIQLAKLIRTFDGTGQFLLAVDAIGNPVYTVAGDFNGDGIPDLGGLPTFPGNVTRPAPDNSIVFPAGAVNPGSDMFLFGESLGGILTGVLPAVEPSIRAAASVSGGGGLTDIALRSSLETVIDGVFLEMFGPFVATCPYSAGLGRCAQGEADAQPTLVMVVADLDREVDLPIAPLTLQPGDKVSVRNLAQLSDAQPCTGDPLLGCATGTADASGNVRVAFTADWPTLAVTRSTTAGAPPAVTVVSPGDPLRIEISGATTAVIDKFGFNTTFYGVTYRKGDPLTAPARGYGRTRNTPEFRRMIQLSQIALDPGDPINYAPYYFQDQLAARLGLGPVPTLVVATVGDPAVPTSTAVALARAAGIVEMNQPDPSYGIPVDRVLIESGVVEGVARTQRFATAAFGPRATLPDHVRCDTAMACTGDVLVDPSGYSCDGAGGGCTDGIDAPRLSPPLRAQLLRPVPLLDGTTAFSGLMLPYLSRTGQHGFQGPQPQKAFDIDQYMANVIGRYFETRGREVHFEPCQAALLAGCPWMVPPPP